jgi:putative oxidoreductase
MSTALEGPLNLAGRILLSLIFFASGAGKIGTFDQTADFMASKGMAAPRLFLAGAIALELAGSISVASGFQARWGALLLAIFLVPAALIFHNFWTETDPQAWQNQMANFMKNVALFGAMVIVIARGPGPWSFDARASQSPTQ